VTDRLPDDGNGPGTSPADIGVDHGLRRPSRLRLIVREAASFLAALTLISVITFVATSAIGIDVARSVLGRQVTEEQLQAFRDEYRLDEPLVLRYVSWLGDFVTGDWGRSPLTQRFVRDDVAPRLWYTISLAAVTLLLALPVSLAIGLAVAKRPDTRFDLLSTIGLVVVAATPWFVIGILLVYLFGVYLGLLPVDSSGLSFGDSFDTVKAYILPSLTLALTLIPHFVRMIRTAVRSALAAPYTRSALLLGLDRRTITWKYLLSNASGPIVNVIALEIIWLLGGVIVVENVFGFPGVGQLLVEAIRSGDLITVQAISVLTGALFLLVNLSADLLVLRLNPRLRAA
jgi:peptide/nickel transport system permease protein